MVSARTAVFLMALAAPVFTLAGARAAEPELLEVQGDWEISLSRSEAGEFEVCLAAKTYPNGEGVLFYSDGVTYVLMGLLLERWQLDKRETYDVAIQIDEGAKIPATAVAGDDMKSVLIDLELSPYLKDLTAGGTLALHTGAGPVRFDLSGSGDAIRTMIRCALDNNPAAAQ